MLVARLVAEAVLHSFDPNLSTSPRLGRHLSSPPSNGFQLPDLMCLPFLPDRPFYSPDTDQEVVALA
jgi:hypothetical protein